MRKQLQSQYAVFLVWFLNISVCIATLITYIRSHIHRSISMFLPIRAVGVRGKRTLRLPQNIYKYSHCINSILFDSYTKSVITALVETTEPAGPHSTHKDYGPEITYFYNIPLKPPRVNTGTLFRFPFAKSAHRLRGPPSLLTKGYPPRV
jgi:hypothetical protein